MITKEKFVNIMTRLEELDEQQENINSALAAFCEDFGSFYCSAYPQLVLAVLADNFVNGEDWLDYFVWECDWLRDSPVNIWSDDETPRLAWQIETWEDVYDFLTMEGQ